MAIVHACLRSEICDITEQVITQWTPGDLVNSSVYARNHPANNLAGGIGLDPGPRFQQLKQLLSSLLEDVTTLYSSFFLPAPATRFRCVESWGHFLRRRQQIDDLIYAEISNAARN